MSNFTKGKYYRVDQQGHPLDGYTGTLEWHNGDVGWVMKDEVLYKAPLASLRSENVLQGPQPDLMRRGDSIRLFESDLDEVLV